MESNSKKQSKNNIDYILNMRTYIVHSTSHDIRSQAQKRIKRADVNHTSGNMRSDAAACFTTCRWVRSGQRWERHLLSGLSTEKRNMWKTNFGEYVVVQTQRPPKHTMCNGGFDGQWRIQGTGRWRNAEPQKSTTVPPNLVITSTQWRRLE